MHSDDRAYVAFMRIAPRLEGIVTRLRDSLLDLGGVSEIESDVFEYQFRVRRNHTSHLDVRFWVPDRSMVVDGLQEKDYGLSGDIHLSLLESNHRSPDRSLIFDVDYRWIDYSDKDAWELRIEQLESFEEPLLLRIKTWFEGRD